jgi:hypothetical protein
MATYIKQIQQLREQALTLAEAEATDADEILGLEAGFFEGLLGNYLIENPELFAQVQADEGWQEELEDLLPIDWDEFIYNVKACV